MIGTLAEAQEIFAVVGDRWLKTRPPPPDWKKIGSGRSRTAYLSPSGIVYKICHVYDDYTMNYNELEERNFKWLRVHRKLPKGWSVPECSLHAFEATFTRWSHKAGTTVNTPGRVTVMASEYVDGEHLYDYNSPDAERMCEVFALIGLTDDYGGNVKKSEGICYIIDAGEELLGEK